MPTALITGASRGLGEALATALAAAGWRLILDGRGEQALASVAERLSIQAPVVGIPGDVTDPGHRHRLAEAVAVSGSLDLLVNNASVLGPSPLPPLTEADLLAFSNVLETNVVAPLGVFQAVAAYMATGAIVVNVSSDAAVESYPGWGLYGPSKAALDQLSAVLAAERGDLAVYAFDPGDMRTLMHQDAFPGEDISDRPDPAEVVPRLLRLIEDRPPSGRVVGSDLTPVAP
ncbi:SDR family oxidoreductase [soil metagenome]